MSVPGRDAEAINKLAERLTAISRRELDDRTITPGEAAALVALVSRNEELERRAHWLDELETKASGMLAAAEAERAVLVSERDELQREIEEEKALKAQVVTAAQTLTSRVKAEQARVEQLTEAVQAALDGAEAVAQATGLATARAVASFLRAALSQDVPAADGTRTE